MTTGYGVDIWCTDSVFSGRLARGPMVVLQALYRRLTTPRGTLRGGEEESAYGIDLAGYVGAVGTETALASLPGVVRAELMKDNRVAGIDVTTALSTDAAGLVSIELTIDVELVDEAETFTLTVGVSEVSAALLGVVSEAV